MSLYTRWIWTYGRFRILRFRSCKVKLWFFHIKVITLRSNYDIPLLLLILCLSNALLLLLLLLFSVSSFDFFLIVTQLYLDFLFFLQFRLGLSHWSLSRILNDFMTVVRKYGNGWWVDLEWDILIYAWIWNKIVARFSQVNTLILASIHMPCLTAINVIRLVIASLNRCIWQLLWLACI